MPQNAGTGNLASAQKTIIAGVRYTEQHQAPAMATIEEMTLTQGASTVTVPKVANMVMADLVDGQDIVDEEEIGMTTVDLTASEVGAKIVITDKLVRQSQPAVFSMVARQLGEGMARKKDTDVHALYGSLNGGTAFGATTKVFSVGNFAASIANARGKTNDPFNPIYCIMHPHQTFDYVQGTTPIGSGTTNFPDAFMEERLRNFWTKRSFNGVALFEDGNLVLDSNNDVTGVLAQKDALVVLMALQTKTERQRDASLRGTEIVMTTDYGVFELDDTKGAPMLFEAVAPSTAV